MLGRNTKLVIVGLSAVVPLVAFFFILSLNRSMDQWQDELTRSTKAGASVSRSGNLMADRTPQGVPLVSLDEVYANVTADNGARNLSVAMKLDLELFAEESRDLIETFEVPIVDTILQATREQRYADLQSMPGKLYFKELLVSRINGILNGAVVRDIHFSSFYLQ